MTQPESRRFYLEIRRLRPSDEQGLADFFAVIRDREEDRWFFPFALTTAQASILCRKRGQKDIFYIVADGDLVLGLAMLGGWDDGLKVPTVGLVLHPSIRNIGFGKTLMDFLHKTAKYLGYVRVRLSVYSDNERAVGLYSKIGYKVIRSVYGQDIMELLL